ncbi:MAG: family 43 glycosylhydrolase, partial [Flavobacteriaceae bacterium]|nr:family 43 glycosylhydrolase [Flavobacteriaceae bacterium]
MKLTKTSTLVFMLLCTVVFNLTAKTTNSSSDSNNIIVQDDVEVKGTVKDQYGNALPGVTVYVKESGKGVVTDFDGDFKIMLQKGQTLEFSFLSYTTYSLVFENQETIEVVLQESTVALDEVSINYTNPMFLPNQSRTIGVGDPSSIRWMGKYYMTVTRNPADIGVMMWESDNLVDWEYLGSVSNAPEVRDAWAPEIMYYEGDFYLYTSGPDLNHRALKLEIPFEQKLSPFGRYNVVSTNFVPKANNDIDGSPFRDDDGSLYFLFSSPGAIEYIEMDSPLDGNKPIKRLTDCVANVISRWTEGPKVIKKNGLYYMTYCGNNVQRTDYQVHGASGSSIETLSPAVVDNPVLLHTEGFYNGTGHNHDVLGPDLKTYYTTYHVKHYEGNNTETGKPLMRSLMLDKIEFLPNGNVKSEVTFTEQEAPKLSDWSDDFDRTSLEDKWTATGDWTLFNNFAINGIGADSEIVSTEITASGNYIVESYVKVKSNAVGGLVVANGDVKAYLDYDNKNLIVINGGTTTNIDMSQSNFDAWHEIKVSINNGKLSVWFDNMRKYNESYATAAASTVAYKVEKGEVDFAWI